MTSVNEIALLQAILEQPDDDLPRLAYADLMEERGEDARAGFIRIQIAMEAEKASCLCGSCVKRRGGEQHHNGPCAADQYRVPHPDGSGRTMKANLRLLELREVFYEVGPWALFRRGFVERVEMATADFLAHTKALFSRHPITEVVLTDREPMSNSVRSCSWWDLARVADYTHRPSNVPPSLFARLRAGESRNDNIFRVYPDEAAALAALSRACVRHGRASAGLAQLEEVRR